MERDWWVIRRADKDRLILVECQLTGKLGTVGKFTSDEWDRAGYAAANHYRWNVKWAPVTELTRTQSDIEAELMESRKSGSELVGV